MSLEARFDGTLEPWHTGHAPGSPWRLSSESVGVAAAALLGGHSAGAAESFAVPGTAVDEPVSNSGTETAVFAGGCFWGVQGVFQHVKGVTQAESGYAGGAEATAHYETVGTGDTGHAESVRITYDPDAR